MGRGQHSFVIRARRSDVGELLRLCHGSEVVMTLYSPYNFYKHESLSLVSPIAGQRDAPTVHNTKRRVVPLNDGQYLALLWFWDLLLGFNTAFAREVPLIRAFAGWGWPLTSDASLEYCRNAAS